MHDYILVGIGIIVGIGLYTSVIRKLIINYIVRDNIIPVELASIDEALYLTGYTAAWVTYKTQKLPITELIKYGLSIKDTKIGAGFKDAATDIAKFTANNN